ncbi:MAG: zinc ribbon domain-containing protein [Gammaproteobacteria bacterium]|nr:zinc ribbon domain-containing protein [Gammaproteobacteria bacterium]
MPTYSYLCSDCDHRFDTVQRMSEDALRECPACGKPSLVRQVSAVGFALKGGGWYVTDFRDKGKPKKSDGEACATSSDGATPPAATPAPSTAPADSSPKAAASSD